MKILVTGGSGFIGSNVVEYYARKTRNEAEIVAFDNQSRAKMLGKTSGDPLHNWNYLKGNYPRVKLTVGDIRDFERLKDVAKEANIIIHTAAQVAVTTSVANPRIDFEINALGTLNVLEIARRSDAAVVFTSSNKVYGENVNKIPIEENETRYSFADKRYENGIPENFPIDISGHSPYGCSKLAADIYVQDYAHTYGLRTGVFRMSCIYGERQFGVEDQGWLAWFVIATLTDQPLIIYGNGKQVRDVLYVADLVDAFDRFLSSKVKHDVFNIGGGPSNSVSLLEALDQVRISTGKKPALIPNAWRTADQKVYVSDLSKIVEKLGWKPKTSPAQGIKKLVRWLLLNIDLLKWEIENRCV